MLLIEKLICYGEYHLNLEEPDSVYVKNLILSAFKQAEPGDITLSEPERAQIKEMTVPDSLIAEITAYAGENRLCGEGMEQSFAAYIMALLSPMPGRLNAEFRKIYSSKGVEKACDYLYGICIKNNYIQKTAIEKNIFWQADFGGNYIDITINLSKPEKDNKEIARLAKEAPTAYPKCMLCKENLGFSGNLSKPPRQNIRIIPLKLAGEKWFMQYSPYLYYHQHCIVISDEHRPMSVDGSTIEKLADFVDIFPNYFVGSNASLPIVGGSILSHEHFQGGGYRMPMHCAKPRKSYKSARFAGVFVSTLDWYNSVIRLSSKDRTALELCAREVFTAWHSYTDEDAGVICRTDAKHNAITPVMRKENGVYIFDIILRNNRTDDKYPDGIFHARPEYHNIKKEGIGLIEAMGMFILPGRLLRQTEEISKILTGERAFDSDLELHGGMVETLTEQHGTKLSKTHADSAVRDYINEVCKNILINTAVFKPDEKGNAAFDRFMAKLNI